MLVGPVGRLPVLVLPLPPVRCANPGMHKARRIKAAKLERLERYINVLLHGVMAEADYSGRCRPMLPRFMSPNHANPQQCGIERALISLTRDNSDFHDEANVRFQGSNPVPE